MSRKCLCCGFNTLPKEQSECVAYICPVCFWENDVFMNDMLDLNEKSDSNKGMILNQARENFKKYKACSKEFISKERETESEEL